MVCRNGNILYFGICIVQLDFMSGLREPKLGVVVGRKGVGKTYETTRIIAKYVAGNPDRGILGRKVLIMDINDEFQNIRPIEPRHVTMFSAQTFIEARRIRPITPDGKPISLDDFANILFQVLMDFKGGMLLLEDINGYVSDNMPNDLTGMICRMRHKDVDVIIHYQSMSRIQTKVHQNLNYIRYHKNTDSVSIPNNKKKILDKYEMVQIAELIVNQQFTTNPRFHLYVDMDTEKILSTVSREQIIQAIDKYLDEYDRTALTRISKTMKPKGNSAWEAAKEKRRNELLQQYF